LAVILREPALQFFLQSPVGPVGVDLERRATRVEQIARENASGPIIGVQSGDLLAGLHTTISVGDRGLQAAVGTDAQHRGFGYPAFHDQHGRPWLSAALEDGFRG
jgi:hypothetical protein